MPHDYRIIDTDNYGGDYPDESFHGPLMTKEQAEQVCKLFNEYNQDDRRYYRVVHYKYKLAPGFEP